MRTAGAAVRVESIASRVLGLLEEPCWLEGQQCLSSASIDISLQTAAEALVRWNHPQRGLLPPGEFM